MTTDRRQSSLPGSLKARGLKAEPMVVRLAESADYSAILALLQEMELDYPSRDLTVFWVGELAGRIVAIAELKEVGGSYLLSCVGIREDLRGVGLGRVFVSRVLQSVTRDVYLYTVVPGFFQKVGFVEAKSVPARLPLREIYDCANCNPAICRCLVRKFDAS